MERTFTATLMINVNIPDDVDDSNTALHNVMQNFQATAEFEANGMRITDCEVIGMEAIPEGEEVEAGPQDRCAYCGHSKTDHHSDNHYGPCWHGSGYGFTCPCQQFIEEGEI